MVQWLRHCASNAGGMGLIPGQESNILHVTWPNLYIYIYIYILVSAWFLLIVGLLTPVPNTELLNPLEFPE